MVFVSSSCANIFTTWASTRNRPCSTRARRGCWPTKRWTSCYWSNTKAGNEFAASVQSLIQTYGGARDEKIRSLVLRLHHYAQTRPDADGWLAGQIVKFFAVEPADWQQWLLTAIHDWRDEWLPVLENLKAGNEKAVELADIFSRLGGAGVAPAKSGVAPDFSSAEGVRRDAGHNRPEACSTNISREIAAAALEQIISADGKWPAKRKGILRKPLEDLFDEVKFLLSLAVVRNGNDPLAEDWNWVRGHMTALLRLTQNFAARFAARKRDDGVLDFHDLEQFALKLLWDFAADKPTPTVERWREKLRFRFRGRISGHQRRAGQNHPGIKPR